MTYLMIFFRNKNVQKILEVIFWGIIVIGILSLVLSYIGVIVYVLTHKIHHSTFTWYIIWSVYAIIGITAGIGVAAAVDV